VGLSVATVVTVSSPAVGTKAVEPAATAVPPIAAAATTSPASFA
jgi:hypothetical protein